MSTSPPRAGVEDVVTDGAVPQDAAADVPWLRLDAKMIWVDAVRVLLSMTPAAIAIVVVGVEVTSGTILPLAVFAVVGVVGAVNDALRWVKTRYRVTDEYVERRTGLIVRKYRSIRRDRIRSVDAQGKLRHRLARLRKVTIGAGQHGVSGGALTLDAVSRDAAEQLRHELLNNRAPVVTGAAAGRTGPAVSDGRVLARLHWSWIAYNIVNVWAYVMAAGMLWGVYWLAVLFGLDPAGWVMGLADWDALGWGWTTAFGLVVVGVIGVAGLAVNFVSESWDFRLIRVPTESGTALRTVQGLFRTREVNRDESRLRGVQISEPLLWRWMRMADTTVITTGLSIFSTASTILPRGPVGVARRVAAVVLDREDHSPLDAALGRHPVSALRRRLLWAVLIAAGATGVAAWLGRTVGVVPASLWWIVGIVALPLLLALALVSYRALGHTISGEYVVTRSGVAARATAAVRRSAVSGVVLRQSLLQRRLGLMTVAVTTAAGYGRYAAPDADAHSAVRFANEAAQGMLDPFLESSKISGGSHDLGLQQPGADAAAVREFPGR